MNGRLKESKIVYYEKNLDQITKHISETELVQEKAERDIVQMKCAEYMQDKIGNVYVGKVSSLTSFGVYVMLDNTIEGLCHFSNMDDDFYYFVSTISKSMLPLLFLFSLRICISSSIFLRVSSSPSSPSSSAFFFPSKKSETCG